MPSSTEINELATALAEAQSEFTGVEKDGLNPHFGNKFASLAAIVAATTPILSSHGLSITQHLSFDEQTNSDLLTTWLLHSSGQFISDSMRLYLPKQDPQGQGSATSYAKRYAWQAVCGVVADADDDGNAASAAPRATVPSGRPPAAAPSLKDKVGAAAGRTSPDVSVAANGDEVAATTPQQGKLYAEQNRLGWSDDDVASYIQSRIGIAVTKSGRNWPITKKQATAIIDGMVKGEGMETVAAGEYEDSEPF